MDHRKMRPVVAYDSGHVVQLPGSRAVVVARKQVSSYCGQECACYRSRNILRAYTHSI